MQRTTMTVYLPQETLEQAKIAAVKANLSFSDLALSCVLAMIGDDTFDRQLPKPSNDEKTMIYLTEDEKTNIKLFAANHATTLSQLIYQALERYMMEKIELPSDRKKPAEIKDPPKSDQPVRKKKKPYSYRLTNENEIKLRTASASTGKTRTQLIFEAVENTAEKDILKASFTQPLTERSSMNLTQKELLYFRKKANRLNLTITELFNKVLAIYL
ncbi:MAG: hypothetical protein GX325_10715 [Peptococcaceae bacterium]|nr:hypothetical protein [Peptococcaceae bacterium]